MAMLTSGAAPSSPFFTGSLGDFGFTKAVAGSSIMLVLVNSSTSEAKKSSWPPFGWLSSGVSFEPSKCNCKRIYDPRTEWDSMIFAKGLTSFPNNYCNDSRKHRCQMNSTHRKTSHSFTHCRKSKVTFVNAHKDLLHACIESKGWHTGTVSKGSIKDTRNTCHSRETLAMSVSLHCA